METTSTGKTAIKSLLVVLVSPVVYVVGLIAPLTPTEGYPTVLSLLGFWLLPMAALAAVWTWDRSIVGRVTSSVVFVLILASYAWISLPMWLT